MTIRLVKKITCILTVAGTATPVNNVLAASATTYYAQTGPQILADGGPAGNMHQHLAVQPHQHHYNEATDPQLYTQLCPDQNNQSNNICGPRWRCKTAVVGGIIAACTVPFWKPLNQKLFPSIFSPASSTTSTSTTLYPGGGTYVDPSALPPVYTNNYPFPQTGSSSWTTTSGGPLAPTPFVNTWTVTTSLAPEVEPPKVGQESTSTTTSTVLEVVPPSSSSPDNGHTGDIKKCDLLTGNDLDKRVLFEPGHDKLLLHVAAIYQGRAAVTLNYDVGDREYVIVLKSSILFDVISGAKDIVEAVNHAELPPSATSSSTSKANNFLAQIAPNYHPPKAGLSAALKRFNSGGQWVVVKDLFCNNRILGAAAGVSEDYQLQRYACHSLPELSREVMERLVVATKDEHDDAEISTRQVKEMRDFVRRVAQMIANVAMHFNYIQERIEETSRVAFVNAEWRYYFGYYPAMGRKNDQLRLAPLARGATMSTIELEQQNKRSPVYVDANTIEQIKQLGCNIRNIDSPPLAQVASNKKELSFAGECNCSEDSRRYCNTDTIFDSHTDPSGCMSFCCS